MIFIFTYTKYFINLIIISLFQTRPTESPVVNVVIENVTGQEDTEMHSLRNISPIPGTSHNDAIPASSTSKSIRFF